MTARHIQKSVFTCNRCGLTVDLPAGKEPETWGFIFDANPTQHVCQGCIHRERDGEPPRGRPTVFDERWRAAPTGDVVRDDYDHGQVILEGVVYDQVIFAGVDRERSNLASASPDLFRALLAAEWGAEFHAMPACPVCEGFKTDGHRADCIVAAAIRKARGE